MRSGMNARNADFSSSDIRPWATTVLNIRTTLCTHKMTFENRPLPAFLVNNPYAHPGPVEVSVKPGIHGRSSWAVGRYLCGVCVSVALQLPKLLPIESQQLA